VAVRKLDRDSLSFFAKKYVWWKSEDEAGEQPERVIAQVMNIGDFDDVQTLVMLVGTELLKKILNEAEIGQFSPRSWSYWHYRLDLAAVDEVPTMPSRRLG
jgi:hypothetical protein